MHASSTSKRAMEEKRRPSCLCPQTRCKGRLPKIKDQTYFLCNLKQQQLSNALFPVGELDKSQVRAMAKEMNLPTQNRKDSQGICFLGKLKFEDFIGHHLGENPGQVLDFETGKEIGEHKGLWFHTIGQRKGLGQATAKFTHLGPWYVAAKDVGSNILYVTNRYEEMQAPRNTLDLEGINWISGVAPTEPEMHVRVKMRHGPHLHDAAITLSESGERAFVRLQTRDAGLAPGQYAAIYDAKTDECLAGGAVADSTFLTPSFLTGDDSSVVVGTGKEEDDVLFLHDE